MFDWLVEAYLEFVKSLPVLFADETSSNFMLIRTMLGLLLIVFVIYLIARRPFRSTVQRCLERVARVTTRHRE
jgi:hypothetical protein